MHRLEGAQLHPEDLPKLLVVVNLLENNTGKQTNKQTQTYRCFNNCVNVLYCKIFELKWFKCKLLLNLIDGLKVKFSLNELFINAKC